MIEQEQESTVQTPEFLYGCPHCGQGIRVFMSTKLRKTSDPVPLERDPVRRAAFKELQQAKTEFQPADLELIERFKADGLFEPFATAVKAQSGVHQPASMERFLLLFLEKARAVAVPQFALEKFRNDFPRSTITVLSSDGVCAVLANGVIRLFLPSKLVKGLKIKSINTGAVKGRTLAPEQEFQEWIRTRNGYVAGKGAMFTELVGRQPGHFALPGL